MTNKDTWWPAHENGIGELICSKDWSETPLGVFEDWPQILRSALNMCLISNSPTSICWGEDLLFFHNSSWSELLGDKNSSSLGQPAREVFAENWQVFSSSFKEVLSSGKVQKINNQALNFTDGKECFFDFSLSPIPDEDGKVRGIYCIATETNGDIQKSDGKYRTLFESIDEGFCIIQILFDEDDKPVNYRYLETNPAYEKHTGLENVEGKTAKDTIPDLEEWWHETYGKVAMTGESTRFEKYNDELQRWFNIYAFRIGEPGERKVAVLFKDITKRKEAEQNLIKNRNRLRTALEIETVGVLFWDGDDFTITEVNDAFLNMSGYSREEVLGKSWQEITPEEYYPVSEQGVEDLKQTGQPEPYEKQYIRKDGSRWWGLCAPRRIDDNEVVEFLLDITDRKEAEQEREQLLKKVEAEKKRLSDIFKQAPSFMCIVRGPDHVFERANDYYRELVGNRELIGQPVAVAIPEAKEQGLIDLLDEVYETGEPFRANEMSVKLHRQPGEPAQERFLDFVYQPIRDPEGSINGIFVQGVDLTERHYAKEELKAINETLEDRVEERTKKLHFYQKQLRSLTSQLNKAEERERQRLAAELHDKLGQMLAVAKMKTDELQHNQVFDQKPIEVDKLKQVLDDALKYNQNLMAELKPPPVLDKEDVTEVLYWTVKNVQKQGLDIDVKNDGKPKPVEKDIRTMLHQSVRELLQNVIKHADVNEARLVMSRENNQVKVTVEDEGKGFDLNNERLTLTEEGRFGLFNIQERMDWHGGTFTIDTEPGNGTTATLYAPLKEKRKSDEPVREKQISPPADIVEEQAELWQKINVLLVDDHEMVRRGLRQMIEKQDDLTIVAEASNGKEAIELAHETSPDIIVMDVNMPVLDGIEATHKIKAAKPNIRIIGLSLHDSQEVIQDMRSAGASDYLTKDEAFETLCTTIRNEAEKVQR